MKVVILGGNGMLGSALSFSLRESGFDVVTIGRSGCQYNLDCLNLDQLKVLLERVQPDVIVNCLAIVNLRLCEDDRDLAYKSHVKLSEALSVLCQKTLYISTDSVYDGELGHYSKETDNVNPLNYYSASKLLGEESVIKHGGVVLRANIYGFKSCMSGGSLFEWAYKSAINDLEVDGYSNLYFNPLSIFQLSSLISLVLSHNQWPVSQVFNVGCRKGLSKFDFVEEVYRRCNKDTRLVNKVSYSKGEIIRPEVTLLDCSKFEDYYDRSFYFGNGMESVFSRLR